MLFNKKVFLFLNCSLGGASVFVRAGRKGCLDVCVSVSVCVCGGGGGEGALFLTVTESVRCVYALAF